MTLVELLVVVVILTTLVAAAIPIMAPSSDARRLREGARSLQTAITSAQTRATELGRPYGIWLQRFTATQLTDAALQGMTADQINTLAQENSEDRGAVLTVHFCEEPQPFGGFSADSKVILARKVQSSDQPDVTSNGIPKLFAVFGRRDPGSGLFVREPLPPNMLQAGDRLMVGDAEYEFLPADPGGMSDFNNTYDGNGFLRDQGGTGEGVYLVARTNITEQHSQQFIHLGFRPQPQVTVRSIQRLTGTMIPAWSYPQSYVIRRLPKKTGDPLQLPAGIAIDLEASGDRGTADPNNGFYHDPLAGNNNDDAVVVLFSPGGAVHSVIRNVGGSGSGNIIKYPGDGPIYLMVARRETIGASTLLSGSATLASAESEELVPSWRDPESLWVTVNPQTGRVTTDENAVVDEVTLTTLTDGYPRFVQERRLSRVFAQRSQNMGGR